MNRLGVEDFSNSTFHGLLSLTTKAINQSINNEVECAVINDVEDTKIRKYMAIDATIKLEICNEKIN